MPVNLPPAMQVLFGGWRKQNWPWVYKVEWDKLRHKSNLKAMPVQDKCMVTRCCQIEVPKYAFYLVVVMLLS